jgi:extracellular factor (EF) 3-hydroxypalmitic acid methyl ester biosynthesis protein
MDTDPRGLSIPDAHAHSHPSALNVEIVKGNIISKKGLSGMEGDKYDIVYSFGLFDYLEDRMLLHTIKNSLEFLKEGGEFIFCLKDIRYYDAAFYDFLFNWNFVPRVIDDGYKIADLSGLKVNSISQIKHGTVIIYRCTKK